MEATVGLSTTQVSAESGIDALWAEFKQTGSTPLRNQLIIYYSPFVKYVASRVLASLPGTSTKRISSATASSG